MDIAIPTDCPNIYIMYNSPIITRQDEQASQIVCYHRHYATPRVKLGDANGLSFTLQSVPENTPIIMQVDHDNYYYMYGRTDNEFIVMLDKKSKKNLTLWTRGTLFRRFKVYAKKRYNFDPRQIHSIVMHNFKSH